MIKEKSKSGTILKLSSAEFSKKELEDLWDKHNQTLQELDSPTEKYTRFTSDLIRSLRDTSEQLILAGAIPDATTRKDTAAYVWKKLKERNIPYSYQAFYKLFDPEQIRDWQTDEGSQTKPSDHKHEFQSIGKISGMGEVSRCGAACDPKCQALLIDGRLFEQQELEEKEPELKPEKQKSNFEQENEDYIAAYENVISKLKAVVNVWRTTKSNLTKAEMNELRASLYSMKKAGEFVDMCYDRKNLIAPFTQHLLSFAYGEATQKNAGGAYIMYRMDLGQRKHGEAVKDFTKAAEFAKLLSGKQTAKAMKGKIRILNERYEPQNEKQAMDTGFSGQQCIDCHYWRVGYDQVRNIDWKEGDPIHEKSDTLLICFHCMRTQKRKHFVLPKQVPQVTIDYQGTS